MPSDAGARLALRAHYDIRLDPSDPGVCIRSARTAHGLEMLPAHFAGWQLTHDLLGDAAPRYAEFDGEHIRTERIPGRALHEHYGGARRGESVPRLPWGQLFDAIVRVYESARGGPGNAKLIPEMAWTTWFSLTRIADAKHHAVAGALRHPGWSVAAAAKLAGGRMSGGFARTPPVVFELASQSKTGLTLGDLHMANLVGSADRIAFVDFSEVAEGSVALDLAPLWMEWWLAQGLVHGDDGFLDGFAEMWRRFAGTEATLIRMTGEFTRRLFAWMRFAFYFDHLRLDRAAAEAETMRAGSRIVALAGVLPGATGLQELVAKSPQGTGDR